MTTALRKVQNYEEKARKAIRKPRAPTAYNKCIGTKLRGKSGGSDAFAKAAAACSGKKARKSTGKRKTSSKKSKTTLGKCMSRKMSKGMNVGKARKACTK